MSVSDRHEPLPYSPIAAAAFSTEYFEKTLVFTGKSEIRLSKALARQAGSDFQASGTTTAVKNYTLENVILDEGTLLLIKDGLIIPETGYFLPEHIVGVPKIDETKLASPDPNSDYIVGFNKVHNHYQHWLTQCLPAIDWSLRKSRERNPTLILPRLEHWQEDFLSLLDHGSTSRLVVEANVQYFLPRVEYSEFLNGSTSFGVCLSALDTARRVLRAVPADSSPHTVLYVPCANPYYGRIGNESEVIGLLRQRGVHIVDRSALTIADRINLFRNAHVVIGPLGEGLTDVLFCRAGALLWEWMPRHHQNASFNRLAQAVQVDYWGDLFETSVDAGVPGEWVVDLEIVRSRLSEMSARLPLPTVADTTGQTQPQAEAGAGSMPVDELMLAFESLGDNCEFGLVQRHGGSEPLGLLRFAGFHHPIESRLDKLVTALGRAFEGLGAAETIKLQLDGDPGKRREYIVTESAYDLQYHTFISEGDVEPDELAESERRRLGFLRGKLLEDLAAGEKIWVWKSRATSNPDQIEPLLRALRAHGPNTLLWVVESDDKHPPGSVERLGEDLIKGYVERFAPYENATDVRPISWFEVCQKARDLCSPGLVTSQPAEDPSPLADQPLSAMDLLTRSLSVSKPDPEPRVPPPLKGQSWLVRLFRRRRQL